MNVFILGLRRSGTTIFWETLRQDKRFTCYDEPFNPHLKELPSQNVKETRDEFIKIYEEDPTEFNRLYSPIYFREEVQPGLSDEQTAYLRYIIEKNEHNVFDFTRCNFKVDALLAVDPNASVIHLVRDPAGFISSHLGCQYRMDSLSRKLKNYIRRRFFWQFRSHFDGYGLETIVDELLYGIGPICEGFRSQYNQQLPVTAVEKLLCLWKYSMDCVDESARGYKMNYRKIYIPDFLTNPDQVLSDLYSILGFPIADFDLNGIRPPRSPLFMGDKRWSAMAVRLKIDQSYFQYADC